MSENVEVVEEAAVEPETVATENVAENVAEEPAEAVPETPPAPDFSAQFAAIARKEAAIQSRQQDFKSLQAQVEELKGQLSNNENLSGLAKTNPLEFLKKNGVSIKDLLHQDLNGELPAESVMTRKIEEQAKQIQALIEAQENKEKEAQKAKESGEWNQFVDQVTNFVDNDGKYELIRAGNMQWMVPQLMRDFYENNGKEITASQAADLVEESLEESLGNYLKADKLKKKYGLEEPTSESQDTPVDDAGETEPTKKAQRKPKTLTNQLVSGTSEKDTGLLSREQSLERIARMLSGGG